ncbi:hypothetical protein CGGC5_v017148 [Colletotrichum fructicola Nara gc5]|uniref:Uncharacterized protein n=1 Tax=Colletotrichum fructicola (strain Nara gc5) TaxID=1213859 RepID=A0A7J6IE74_COLFN|nr:hypothetical protein CGGC5_v017148 [Colletotrichum fructicola Nara gc5]
MAANNINTPGSTGSSSTHAGLTAAQLQRASKLKEARQGLDQGGLAYNGIPVLTKDMNFELWENNVKSAFRMLGLLVYIIHDAIPDGYTAETVFTNDESKFIDDPTYIGDPGVEELTLAKSLLQKKVDYKLMEEMVEDGLPVTSTAFQIIKKAKEFTQKFHKLAVGKIYDDWNHMSRVDYGNTKDFITDLYSKFTKLNGSGLQLSNKALAYRIIWGFRRFDQAKADSMENDFVMGIRNHEDLVRELKGLGEKEAHEQASQSVGINKKNKQTPTQQKGAKRKGTESRHCNDCKVKHPEMLHKCQTCNCYHKANSTCPVPCNKCPYRHYRDCTNRYNRFEHLNNLQPASQANNTTPQASNSVFASAGLAQDSVFGNSGINIEAIHQTEAYKQSLRHQVARRTLPIFPVEEHLAKGHSHPLGPQLSVQGLPNAERVEQHTGKPNHQTGGHSASREATVTEDIGFAEIAIEDEDEDGTNIQDAHLDRYVMSTASLRRTDSFMLDTGASRHILNDLGVFEELRDLPQGLSMNCVGRKDQIGKAVGTAKVIATKPNGKTTTF